MRTVLGIVGVCLLLLVPTTSTARSVDDAARHHAQGVRPHPLAWKSANVHTAQNLRGLDATDRRHAWVGGSDGGVWRTADGGRTWKDVSPPDTAGLQFRDVEILAPGTVLVLAIGEGAASRVYRTTDSGRTWTQTFANDDVDAFYDCLAMWPGGQRGIAMSDPVDGRFRVIETSDGGATWSVVDPAGMPDAVDGEGGFAASGTCVATAGSQHAYIASGVTASRIFHSRDGGRTWTATSSTIPIPADPAEIGGTFSMDFRNPLRGLAVGGNLNNPGDGRNMSAFSHDRGRTWKNGGNLGGYRSAVAWVPGVQGMALAVGPTGSDVTRDGGRRWKNFDGADFDAVQCSPDGSCWASGPAGAVARLRR